MSFMSGSGSGVTMAFVNLDIKWAEENGKHGTTALARSWSSLLENGGVKVQVYDTDPGSILIVNQNPMNNLKIKEFVMAQPHVDYYELNQRRSYPDGRTAPIVPDAERKERIAQIPGRLGDRRPEPVRKPAPTAKTGETVERWERPGDGVLEGWWKSSFLLLAQVEQLELRVQELQAELLASRTERSEELQELHAIVDAQEAVPEPPAEPEEGEAPLPPPPRRSRGESGPSTGSGARPKRSSHPSTASGYGKTVESSREQREQREQREREPPRGSGSMSTPGLRSGKLEVRKEKSEPNSRSEAEVELVKAVRLWQWGRFGMSKVLARFWARRYGRGRGFTPGPPGGHVWRHGLFWLLWSFTSVAATPTVVYVRVQAASGETTVAANETVEDVRLDSEVRLIFDEDIILHSDGKATLWDGTSYSSYSQGAGLVIPAADPSHLVLNEGNADANFLTEFVAYYLRLDPNTVRSASDGSASVTFEYSFSTGDFTAPILSSVSPSYSEPSALPGVAPILTFSESISAAADTAKVISIQNLYTGLSSVLTCRSNSVVIEDSRVSINSGGFITYCQRYEVTYSAGCFLDVSPSENAVAALSSGTYTFETSCITSLNPPSDVETLALDGSLQLTFSEAVQRGTGSIILLPLSFADEYRAIPIHDTTQVSFDTAMTTMTIIPNDPLLASSVAQSNWCRINAMSLNDCKGQTWDITIGSSVLQRVTPTTLLAQVDLLQPLQAAGSAGQTYRVRTKAADVTPPVITMVSTHGTSESSIRVTLRPGTESGVKGCQNDGWEWKMLTALKLYLGEDGAGGQKLGVTLAEIGTSFSSSAVFSSSWGYAEMDIDVTDLVAKTYYNVFCYAKDLEAPAPNVVTVGAALATRQRVRSMDTTAPSSSNCSAQAVAGREDAIEVTLTLDEPGTAYCALVRSGLVAPSHYVVTAAGFKANTSFYPPYDASMVVDMSSGSTGLAPLTRGTDYDIFCRRISFHTVIFPGNGQGVPLQCGPPGAVGVVRTLDLTPPQMSITDVEVQPDSLSSDFEALIKAQSSNCTDSFGNECGSFWVYDLDDLEDSAADGADFDHSKWKYQEDVSILLLNLEEVRVSKGPAFLEQQPS
ncbi:unnamed protein product [Durusdinium trenchii]|uniref:Uncharacterized protein n=1 Tax=Durusdinium trenchii TaxID=1381693 RepID=A0ABP0HW10_9DINO